MRQYGNGLVVGDPVQETAEGWYFTHHFVDLETMVSKTRQYFQSKREDVGMRVDQFRANQIRFNKGQSKAIRNCIMQAMPRTLVLQALQAAKKGVSAKMEAFIKSKGLPAAQTYTLSQLKGVGVDEAAVLAKAGKERVADLVLEDLVMLAADYKAIENGDAHASELFELREAKPSGVATDLKSKLKAQVGVGVDVGGDVAKASQQVPKFNGEPVATPSGVVSVKPGKQPFTYYVTDMSGDHLTHVDGDKHSCNCGKMVNGTCAHIDAVERFIKG
jgi:hypothetical protein